MTVTLVYPLKFTYLQLSLLSVANGVPFLKSQLYSHPLFNQIIFARKLFSNSVYNGNPTELGDKDNIFGKNECPLCITI